jgi:hypothetical protein
MPSVSGIQEKSTKTWAEKLTHFLDTAFRKIADIPFNNSSTLTVADSGNANTEIEDADSVAGLKHGLGRVPNGFILTKTDKAANIYDSGTTWTTTRIYLKCDAANAAITLVVY